MEQVRRQGLAAQPNNSSGYSAESELAEERDIGSNLSSLIRRVSAASVSEIEMLIVELQGLRDFLVSEGQRVQHEIATYARLSQAAIESTKIINESLLKWKAAPDRRP